MVFVLTSCTRKVDSVLFSKNTYYLHVGESEELIYKVFPEHAAIHDIQMISSNPHVVKVQGESIIAEAEGTATIRAMYGDVSFGACTVYVKHIKPESLYFTSDSFDLSVGGNIFNFAKIEPVDTSYKIIKLESSDTNIVQVYGNSVLGVAKGSAIIKAYHVDGLEAECIVNVHNIALEKLEIVGETTLVVGDSSQLTVVFTPRSVTDKDIEWRSSNTSVLTVDNGVVTAHNIGVSRITVRHVSGFTATKDIEVFGILPNKVTMNAFASLYDNEKITLETSIEPSDTAYKSLEWISDDTSIATVYNGVVSGVSAGKTVIRAKTINGKEAQCTVTVKSSTKEVLVYISSTCPNYNHVGNEWGFEYLINGVPVKSGSKVTLKRNGKIDIKTTIVEYDQYDDISSAYYTVDIDSDYYEHGFKVTKTIYVTENYGDFAGNTATWTVEYTFKS